MEINGQHFDETSDGKPIAFGDLPADAFPFMVRYLREDGHDLGKGPMVGWCVVDGPMVMEVPGFGSQFPVSCQILYANGTSVLITSDGTDYYAPMPENMVAAVHTIAARVADGTIVNGQMPPVQS